MLIILNDTVTSYELESSLGCASIDTTLARGSKLLMTSPIVLVNALAVIGSRGSNKRLETPDPISG